ncbi:hypothetical protein ACFPMF_10655 [Larkinella bovis]|uniref:Lipocalin-like domain-containing protein n=1 Tax=Larkinella bovis TaxID=683041 RepID=A0ABW0IB68_9BACT
MKQLILFVLVLVTAVACKKSDQEASSPDPLFQHWKLVATKTGIGSWETVADGSLMEFRADGTIHYQKPEPACCAPIRFERQPQTLKLTDFYSGGDCIYVDCAPPTAYNIVSLTADELILENVQGAPYPGAANQYAMKYKPSK